MTTNFPSSIDAFTNPTSGDTLDNPPHDQQHADINDAMEAVQTSLLDGAPLHIDDANERVGIGTSSPEDPLHVVGDVTIEVTDDGSAAQPEVTLHRGSASPADGDYLGQVKFSGKNDNSQTVNYAKITGKISDASDTTEDGLIEIANIKDGSQSIGYRFTSSDLKLINGRGLEVDGDVTVDTDTLHVDTTNHRVGIGTNTPVSQLDMPDVSSTGAVFSSNNWNDGIRLQNSSTLRWTKNASKIWAVGQSTDNLYFGNTTSEGTSTPMAYHQIMYGDGYVSTPSNPYVLLKNTNTQWRGYTGGYTYLDSSFMGSAWTVVTSRGGNHFNTSTATFTAPVSGVYFYHFTTYMLTSGITGSNYAHPLITINGSPSWVGGNIPYQIYGHNIDGYSEGITSTYTVFLNQNDALRPYWYIGSTARIYPGYSSLAITFLG